MCAPQERSPYFPAGPGQTTASCSPLGLSRVAGSPVHFPPSQLELEDPPTGAAPHLELALRRQAEPAGRVGGLEMHPERRTRAGRGLLATAVLLRSQCAPHSPVNIHGQLLWLWMAHPSGHKTLVSLTCMHTTLPVKKPQPLSQFLPPGRVTQGTGVMRLSWQQVHRGPSLQPGPAGSPGRENSGLPAGGGGDSSKIRTARAGLAATHIQLFCPGSRTPAQTALVLKPSGTWDANRSAANPRLQAPCPGGRPPKSYTRACPSLRHSPPRGQGYSDMSFRPGPRSGLV